MGKLLVILWFWAVPTLGALVLEASPWSRTLRIESTRQGSHLGVFVTPEQVSFTSLELSFVAPQYSVWYGRDVQNPITGTSRGWRFLSSQGWEGTLFTPLFDRSSLLYLSLGGRKGRLGTEMFGWYRPDRTFSGPDDLIPIPSLYDEPLGAGLALSVSSVVGESKLTMARGYRSHRYVRLVHELSAGPLSVSFRLGEEEWPVAYAFSLGGTGKQVRLDARIGKRWGPVPLFAGQSRAWRAESAVSGTWEQNPWSVRLSSDAVARYTSASNLSASLQPRVTIRNGRFSTRLGLEIGLRPKRELSGWTCSVSLGSLSAAWSDDGVEWNLSASRGLWRITIKKRWGYRPELTVRFTTGREN
ncbi:MAG: hypothetical protein LKK25_05155 [Sphaerochaeta sp.]|nr:hypothetical protein [Sphaerochaeta sp.]